MMSSRRPRVKCFVMRWLPKLLTYCPAKQLSRTSINNKQMPFKSKQQMKACFAQKSPKWDCKKWAKETKNLKSLPKKVSRKKSK